MKLNFVPNTSPNGIKVKDAFKQMKRVFRKKSLCFAYIVSFIPLFSFVGMYTILNSFLSNPSFGFSTKQIFFVRLIGVLGMVLSPMAGKLVKRLGALFVLRAALVLSIIGLIFIVLSSNIIIVVFMSVIFVIGIAIAVPTLICLIGQLGGEARGAAVSVYTFILFLGASIGPMFTVLVLKNENFAIAFVSIAIVMLIGVISTFFIKIEKNN